MSGGQQQWVAITRSIINSPKLILADELTVELESGSAREALELFKDISQNDRPVITFLNQNKLNSISRYWM